MPDDSSGKSVWLRTRSASPGSAADRRARPTGARSSARVGRSRRPLSAIRSGSSPGPRPRATCPGGGGRTRAAVRDRDCRRTPGPGRTRRATCRPRRRGCAGRSAGVLGTHTTVRTSLSPNVAKMRSITGTNARALGPVREHDDREVEDRRPVVERAGHARVARDRELRIGVLRHGENLATVAHAARA